MHEYQDRSEAGHVLAEALKAYTKRSDVLVLALPRGGVPVAYEIAEALSVPLDVFIVRKLGVPDQEELAFGAIARGGGVEFNEELIRNLNISQQAIQAVIAAEQQELNRREVAYRDAKPFPELKNKTVILVDDGIATGATMRAAVNALRKLQAAIIIMAVPVAPPETCKSLGKIVDKVVCPLQPAFFYAVGAHYKNFPQTSDKEVKELLKNQ